MWSAALDFSHLSVCGVSSLGGNEILFRIKRSTQLKKLMVGGLWSLTPLRSCLMAACLLGERTPDELEMEEGDEIDAVLHHTGGSAISFGSCS
ncbi:hypothetical protein RJ641_015210 [Dillenia turbinata]|uniref:Ubiquitin-like domain-containing protein n=1 Tax=Dillenia turbinata TaxID=194707 RepID=A0AAN8YZX8_9MAGN